MYLVCPVEDANEDKLDKVVKGLNQLVVKENKDLQDNVFPFLLPIWKTINQNIT